MGETEDELLRRLEREEEENRQFQVLKEKRKKNPFWSQREDALNGGGAGGSNEEDVMEKLEKRLKEQQQQQEINDHLEELQTRLEEVESKGGSDVVAQLAKEKVEREIELRREQKLKVQEQDDAERAKLAFELRNQQKRPMEPVDNNVVAGDAQQPPTKKLQRKRPIIPSTITIKRKPTIIPQQKNEIKLDYSSSSSDSE